jgi:Flp pilus assembly protein CpaB
MKGNTAPTTTPDWQAAVKRRTRFYVLAAVLLAVLFGFLVFQFFSRQQAFTPGETTSALFAADDIPGGTLLTRDMLAVKEVPIPALPVKYLSFREQAVGKRTLYPLGKGEIISLGKLARNQGSILAQRCPARKWCVSIPADWFVAAPMDLSEGDLIEIASVLPGKSPDEAGFIATQIEVVGLPNGEDEPAYVLAVDDQEAISILYARVNEFQMLVLLRPAGG